jgi:hypothetical protein
MTQAVVGKRHDDVTKDRDSLLSRSIAFRNMRHPQVARGGESPHKMENEVRLLFQQGYNMPYVRNFTETAHS